MRHQLLKLTKRTSTKAERRFVELLKQSRIPFRSKVKIGGREIDFLIQRYAIDIDCHEQDPGKNHLLVEHGYIPVHYTNKEVQNLNHLYVQNKFS